MSRIHHRSCNLCEAMCGLLIEHDGERVLGLRGDPDDPLSRGHLCPKAFALRDLHEDPDRLCTPLRRTPGGDWQAIGWDAALDEVAEQLSRVQRQHGRDAVAVYQGNPTVHNLGSMLFAPAFVRTLRTKNRYSATSVDQLPHHFLGYHLFGHQLRIPVPDIDRTHHLLILGANPLVSNGSIMSAPGVRKRIAAVRERGSVVVIDPRRTETAARADRHHPILPGTDALALAAMVRHLLVTRGPTLGHLAPFTDGVARLQDALGPFDAERVAESCGIPAATLRQLADDFADAPSAVCYGRLGVCTAEFGGLGIWLTTVLTAITGNLDQPGGLMFPRPAVDLVDRTSRGGHGRWRSRVRGLAEFGGELPVATLADEILTQGEGQVRALVTSAGNPVLSTPDGRRLGQALAGLDFMVSIDPYLNETTRHAHIILPPRIGLEVPHYDLAFHNLAVRNTARYADALFPGAAGSRSDAEIFRGLITRLRPTGLSARDVTARVGLAMSPSQQLDVALRRGPYGAWGGQPLRGLSLKRLRAAPHGVDLGPLEPALPEGLRTRDGRLDLSPDVMLADLARLEAALSRPAGDQLALIGRRALQDHNSWLHNAPSLMKGRPRCTLHLHPDDAARRGLRDGDLAVIRSRVGEVRAPVVLTEAMRPGVVSLPHGWGHGDARTRQRVAASQPGVSVNDLTDPQLLDTLTGNAALSGVRVEVARADDAG